MNPYPVMIDKQPFSKVTEQGAESSENVKRSMPVDVDNTLTVPSKHATTSHVLNNQNKRKIWYKSSKYSIQK